MFTKKVLLSALFAAGMIGGVATPLTSVAAVDLYLNFAPPGTHRESIPAPRSGYVWAPGYWQSNGNGVRLNWVAGRWERARPGYSHQTATWEERNGQWHYRASRWDRDGDGVPDSQDRRPNDPKRH